MKNLFRPTLKILYGMIHAASVIDENSIKVIKKTKSSNAQAIPAKASCHGGLKMIGKAKLNTG